MREPQLVDEPDSPVLSLLQPELRGPASEQVLQEQNGVLPGALLDVGGLLELLPGVVVDAGADFDSLLRLRLEELLFLGGPGLGLEPLGPGVGGREDAERLAALELVFDHSVGEVVGVLSDDVGELLGRLTDLGEGVCLVLAGELEDFGEFFVFLQFRAREADYAGEAVGGLPGLQNGRVQLVCAEDGVFDEFPRRLLLWEAHLGRPGERSTN